ncbi:hypothetical protein ElyMa_002787300 [Elysia marginata]|uniref:Uncharacterized protein n=1 Tax=Elysia marginata TaxID=1093978 RepID=A0AAV4HR96_9GAST|nr:hypothetical protein ElyMa_002787300 [Elysia marginata]
MADGLTGLVSQSSAVKPTLPMCFITSYARPLLSHGYLLTGMSTSMVRVTLHRSLCESWDAARPVCRVTFPFKPAGLEFSIESQD